MSFKPAGGASGCCSVVLSSALAASLEPYTESLFPGAEPAVTLLASPKRNAILTNVD